MSIQVVASPYFYRNTLRYFLFSLVLCFLTIFFLYYNIVLFFLLVLFVSWYIIANAIRSRPISFTVSDTSLFMGSFVLPYSVIKDYRLITVMSQNKPSLYGIRFQLTNGKVYYYRFQDSKNSIKKRVVFLDQYVSKSPDIPASLKKEVLDITKL